MPRIRWKRKGKYVDNYSLILVQGNTIYAKSCRDGFVGLSICNPNELNVNLFVECGISSILHVYMTWWTWWTRENEQFVDNILVRARSALLPYICNKHISLLLTISDRFWPWEVLPPYSSSNWCTALTFKFDGFCFNFLFCFCFLTCKFMMVKLTSLKYENIKCAPPPLALREIFENCAQPRNCRHQNLYLLEV